MKQLRTALLAAALTAGAAPAWAQPLDGFYVGAGIGPSFMQQGHATADTPAAEQAGAFQLLPSSKASLAWQTGFSSTISGGFGFGNGLRLELEASIRRNAQSHTGGSQQQIGAMTNLLYDIDTGFHGITPYIGVGGGYQALGWHRVGLTANGISQSGGPTNLVSSETLSGLAYQAILGVAVPIAEVPGLSLTAEYRFMDKAGPRNFRAAATSAGQPASETHVHPANIASHSLLLGLRYAFDAPVDAPVSRPPLAEIAAPVAMPARTYLVFFDWNRTDLSPRALEVISEAVRNASRVPHTRIDVTGHADSSGDPKANQLLSLRRAEAVASELRREGIRPEEISMHAVGDTAPLLVSPAGTREPQNRVVEIVYR